MTPTYDLAHLLPHRPPFRLLDRIREFDLAAGRLLGERALSADDPLFSIGMDTLSPLLIIEALCQAAACLHGLEQIEELGTAPTRHRGYLVSAAGFEFPEVARSGDRLLLEVTRTARLTQAVALSSFQGVAWAAPAQGKEAGRLVAKGRLLFAVTIA